MEAFVIDDSNTTKLMHDVNGPSPSPPSLNVVPSLNAILVFGRQKTHCLEMDAGVMRALHSLFATALCQMDQMKATSFPD